jgi:hypothetical protein
MMGTTTPQQPTNGHNIPITLPDTFLTKFKNVAQQLPSSSTQNTHIISPLNTSATILPSLTNPQQPYIQTLVCIC